MDERKLELKRLKKRSDQARRKHTLLWSILHGVSLVLALVATLASAVCVLLGGAVSTWENGRLWTVAEPDENAVYFAAADATETLEALRRKAVAEGTVLLQNNGILPLTESPDLSKLTVGSGVAHHGDVAIVYLKDAADRQLAADTLQQKKDGKLKAVVLVLDTPAVTAVELLPEVDACLWTGGAADGESLSALLSGKQNPSGALAVDVYDSADKLIYPFGYGLSYTEFAYSQMALQYDVATDLFTATVTVTNTGTCAGRDRVLLFVRCGAEAQTAQQKLVAFEKTELLEPGSSQTLTLTAERRALATYDAAGEGGYVVAAGDYTFYTEGAEQPVVGVYTQPEADTQSYRLAPSGVPVKNRLGTEKPATQMPVTGAKNGLHLQSLRGLAYEDPLWESFLDQLTRRELMLLAAVGFREAMLHRPAETVPAALLAASFDTSLARETGKALANSTLAAGKYALAGIGLGTEDICLSGKLLTAEMEGIRTAGVVAMAEAASFSGEPTEQLLREWYLAPYREAFREGIGGLKLVREAFAVPEKEWAFTGVLLDATENTELATTLYRAFTSRNDPAYLADCRDTSHRILYNLVNSAAMNGVGEKSRLQPASGMQALWSCGVTVLCWIWHLVMGCFLSVGKYRWKTGKEYLDYRTMRNALKYKA